MYTATSKDKDAAWYVFKRLKDTARHSNRETGAKIQDSTITCSEDTINNLETIANKISAKYTPNPYQ